jgi:hypothetical protein
MTNTLHKFGAPETFRDDFVIFGMIARGINNKDSKEKLVQFFRLALKHNPVNLGNHSGGMYRTSDNLGPLVHWHRVASANPEEVFKSIDENTAQVAAVFDTPEKLEAFLVDLREADLGLSVNISSLTELARTCCKNAGITRHSVGYSLGFHGDMSLLPDQHVLELSTMCGHGMVSNNLARKMIDLVKEGRRKPKEAAACMARFCVCGVFNPARAERILEEVRKGE